MPKAQTLLTGLAVGESPRWHQDRLWFSHWGTKEICALDLDGTIEVVAHVPTTIGYSIDWLPDGRLLVTAGTSLLQRTKPGADGPWETYADLSHLAGGWSEIVVDGRGNTYVNGSDFDFLGGGEFVPGIIALVTPDRSVRQVADNIAFPNGMAVTPDNTTLIIAESFASRLTAFDIADDGTLSNRRVWAELVEGGDGICLDADGAVWTPVGGRAQALRACSEAQTGEPCSCSRPSGAAPRTSMPCSRTAPARCSSSTRPHPASAGRKAGHATACASNHPTTPRTRHRRSSRSTSAAHTQSPARHRVG